MGSNVKLVVNKKNYKIIYMFIYLGIGIVGISH